MQHINSPVLHLQSPLRAFSLAMAGNTDIMRRALLNIIYERARLKNKNEAVGQLPLYPELLHLNHVQQAAVYDTWRTAAKSSAACSSRTYGKND